MNSICHYLCCCCSCCRTQSFRKREAKIEKDKNLKTLDEITPTSKSDEVWAVTDDPLKVNTEDMTQTFRIPNKEFKTDNDVIEYMGFKIDKQIDSGSFGVILCGHHLVRKLKIAIKMITIPQSLDSKRRAKRDEMLRDVKHELFTLQKIRHPHVVRLITHLMIKREEKVTLYILIQFAENGNLSKYCERMGAIDESKCKLWFAQILSGISYMHRNGIAHRDLKLSNILLDTAHDILITDFGLSRLVWRQSQERVLMSQTFCGTPPYMAPEVLQMESHTFGEYNAFKADVWSFGVILFRMFVGEFPFPHKTRKAIYYMRRKKWKFPKSRPPSKGLESTLTKMFEPNPKKRPRMEKLQNYPWIRDVFRIVEMKSIQKAKDNEQTFRFI